MESKKRSWEVAASVEDAMSYLADGRHWGKEEFFSSGVSDVTRHVISHCIRVNFVPEEKRILDIGCGIGRMTRAFADVFGEAWGVDFSGNMIERAEELNSDKANCFFRVNNGVDLSIFEDNFFDFCFSHATFQHIQDIDIIQSYIAEIGRVLKPGGLFKFSARVRTWGPGRAPVIHRSIYNRLRRTGFMERLATCYFRIRGDSLGLNDSKIKARVFPGVWMSARQLKRMITESGLELVETSGKLWYAGRKTGQQL